MHKLLTFILVAVIAAAVAYYTPSRQSAGPSVATETALQRVKRTGTLRCGYVDYEPANFRDAQSGATKGILVDVAEAMGRKMGVKVEWVIAGGWATFVTDMQASKYDAFCGAAWGLQPPELMDTLTSEPVYYSTISAWARVDTTTFDDNTLARVNEPSVTIAATDGSFPMILAQTRFPKAKIFSLPETASYALNLTNVADGKADIGFVEQYISGKYNVANPGKIKNVSKDHPVYVSGNMFSVLKADADLMSAMEMALAPLYLNGEIDAIISAYEPAPGTFLRRARPYQ